MGETMGNLFDEGLIGLTVANVDRNDGVLRLRFVDQSTLNINNSVKIAGGAGSDLKGTTIFRLSSDDASFVIHFDRGLTVTVGLSDEDYDGPESMELWLADGRIVVWR